MGMPPPSSRSRPSARTTLWKFGPTKTRGCSSSRVRSASARQSSSGKARRGRTPWCYIGKRRLDNAVAALGGQHEVRVRWLPYQLNPTMPREGKFGSWERSLELDARVAAVGEAEGIHFAFDLIERTPNTLDAHRL